MKTINNIEKIQQAIAIFKAELPSAKGKFRPYISEANGNVVEFFNEDGLYCTININTGAVKGI